MAARETPPFRADHVGSLLRPKELLRAGAHPFTLWSFTEAVWIHDKPREELVADYKAKATQAGYPDFKT
jgi:methionine synthase II (cobalamin-independent)